MLEIVALAIAGLSLIVSAAVAAFAAQQGAQLRDVKQAMQSLEPGRELALPNYSIPPLEGKRIGLFIEQDHKLPILFTLIKERLEAEDAEVLACTQEQVEALSSSATWDVRDNQPHAVIHGRVTCNGYKEVYYEADLTFLFCQGIVTSILESPPNGARQANLAISVVKTLKQTLEQAVSRAERSTALKELNS